MKMRIALATIVTTAATLSAGQAYAGTRAGQSYSSTMSKGWSDRGPKGFLGSLHDGRKGGHGWGHGWGKDKGHGWNPGKGGGHHGGGWGDGPDKSHGC